MTTQLDKLKRTKWFKTRPLVVRLAHEIWGPGDGFLIKDKLCYLIGFSETDESDDSGDPHDLMLILSEVDPAIDYDKAVANVFRICAKHFKKTDIH